MKSAQVLSLPLARPEISDKADTLTKIYEEHCNIAVWQREISPAINEELATLLARQHALEMREIVSPENAEAMLMRKSLGAKLSQDIAQLIDMFCCLFGLQQTGMRLRVLDHAMCPRFHVDQVPCRLIHSYCGPGTEWIADHKDLKAINALTTDCSDDRNPKGNKIRQLNAGDVALLKGGSWEGSMIPALIHRSPKADRKRLLLTLDFA